MFVRGVSCSLRLMQGLCQIVIHGMTTAKRIPESIGGLEVLQQDKQSASGNEFINKKVNRINGVSRLMSGAADLCSEIEQQS